MAEPEWNFGFVHDDQDQVDILQSPLFDVGFDFDDTIEDYIDRIQYTLVDVIDEQRSKGRWIIIGRPSSSTAPATYPRTTILGSFFLGATSVLMWRLFFR
ncbi:hypothetical protein MA16_Dca001045 [Dendrobium catenatum]|uniref:Uncharacterized protein n=1 Tax=Dendrobium catenatum TaxID=906689 RepID=A0A2I0WLA5_9ASPA|nr:hypothetical protein MA16_Dca001045 [Dendrobium catenatum]